MQVRQAIVSTPTSRALKQNELVSCSEQISDELARSLCHWSPHRNELAFGQIQSINFFEPVRGTFAISRSVYGDLESTVDGGRRITSHIVLFDRDQLSGYQNDIASVVHVLRSNGSLVLRPNPPRRIPMLDVPEHAFVEMGELARSDFSAETERVLHAIDIHSEVVLLGLKQPLKFLRSFFADIPRSRRLEFSFATGLKVSDDRNYRLQFFLDEDRELIQELANRQLRTISLGPKSWSPQSRVTGSLNDC